MITYMDLVSLPSEQERQGFHERLFHDCGFCVAVLDAELRVQYANEIFLEQLNLEPGQARGHVFSDFFHPSIKNRLERQFAKLPDHKPARFTDHLIVLRPDGSVFSGELTGVVPRDPSGQDQRIAILIKPDRSECRIQTIAKRTKLLTPLDARILEGIAVGTSTRELAARLFLSRGGVEYHVATLLRRMRVTNRPALISKAYSVGMFTVDSWPPRILPEYVR